MTMKVLMVSPEIAPLAKTGGLADALTTVSKNYAREIKPRSMDAASTALSVIEKKISTEF